MNHLIACEAFPSIQVVARSLQKLSAKLCSPTVDDRNPASPYICIFGTMLQDFLWPWYIRSIKGQAGFPSSMEAPLFYMLHIVPVALVFEARDSQRMSYRQYRR